jgi:hypothetical protein
VRPLYLPPVFLSSALAIFGLANLRLDKGRKPFGRDRLHLGLGHKVLPLLSLCYLEHVESNGQTGTEQPITGTEGNDKADPFERRFNQIWLDWSYAMMPAALLTTSDLIRRKTPMDLMAIGSRLALSSWLDAWLQVLGGQRDRRTNLQ